MPSQALRPRVARKSQFLSEQRIQGSKRTLRPTRVKRVSGSLALRGRVLNQEPPGKALLGNPRSCPAVPRAMLKGDLTSKRVALNALASFGNNARHAGNNSPPRQYRHLTLPHARGLYSAHSFGGHSPHRFGLAASGRPDHEAVFAAAVACRSACYSFGWSLHFASSLAAARARVRSCSFAI